MNYVSIIHRQLKSMLKDVLAVIVLSWGLRWQARWILESNGGQNAAEFQRFPSSGIPLYQRSGQRTI